MKRPQKLAVMLVPTPPYEICGLGQIDDGTIRRGAVDSMLNAWVDLTESSRQMLAESEFLSDSDRALLLSGKP